MTEPPKNKRMKPAPLPPTPSGPQTYGVCDKDGNVLEVFTAPEVAKRALDRNWKGQTMIRMSDGKVLAAFSAYTQRTPVLLRKDEE